MNTITRRDTLKSGFAVIIGGAAAPLGAETAPAGAPSCLGDPVSFANHLYSTLAADGIPDAMSTETDAYRAFVVAIRALSERHPDEALMGGTITTADEAAHTWAGEVHAAGVRFGVAAETLRRSLLAGGEG